MAGLGGASALAAGALMAPQVARADRYGPADGTRILIIGDSMIAGGLGLFLARALGEEHGYHVQRRGKSSTGLARPDFYDWEAQARQIVGDEPYDATVVMFGGNDVQGLNMGRGKWIRWPEEGWNEEYARRVAALYDIVAPDQQQVFWVGMPVMKAPDFQERVRRINTIVRAEMAIRRNAEFVDIWSLLADEQGHYADHLSLVPPGEEGGESPSPRPVQVRAGDGVHLTVSGARHVAAHLQRVIHTEMSARAPR